MSVHPDTTAVLKDDTISLDDKLAAIDAMMADAVANAQAQKGVSSATAAPVDPADYTMCLGCQ